jgi:hypothetical protein
MSHAFIKGMLAEKAKIANTLIAEVMAGIPDELLWKYQPGLRAGSTACHNLYADLRGSDTNDESKLIAPPDRHPANEGDDGLERSGQGKPTEEAGPGGSKEQRR